MDLKRYKEWCETFGKDLVDAIIDTGTKRTLELEMAGVEFKGKPAFSQKVQPSQLTAQSVLSRIKSIAESHGMGWTDAKTALARARMLAQDVARQEEKTGKAVIGQDDFLGALGNWQKECKDGEFKNRLALVLHFGENHEHAAGLLESAKDKTRELAFLSSMGESDEKTLAGLDKIRQDYQARLRTGAPSYDTRNQAIIGNLLSVHSKAKGPTRNWQDTYRKHGVKTRIGRFPGKGTKNRVS